MKQRSILKEIYSYQKITAAIEALAVQLNSAVSDTDDREVVVISLLNGGMIFTGLLVPQLGFDLHLDSISVSRYRDKTHGSELRWHAKPRTSLAGRLIILLDDIYDQGATLAQVKSWCVEQGAADVISVVLAWKIFDESAGENPLYGKPDFYALTVPDKFVIGMGMDYAGKYRNAPGIYELKLDNE